MPPHFQHPAATPGHPATTQRFTRDDLVRLGQRGQPWDFIPIAEHALRIAPDDAGLLLLAAANYAKLGLRTAALDKLAAMPAAITTEPGVRQLAGAVDRLPDDRITADERTTTCRANIAALLPRLTGDATDPICAALSQWEDRARREHAFRDVDGNILRRDESGAWLNFRSAVEPAQHTPLPGGEEPLTIEGVDPPWLLIRALNASPRRADGFRRRIQIVEPDPLALCEGLACADLRDPLAQDHVALFLGPRALVHLAADLEARHTLQITGPTLAPPGAPSSANSPGPAAQTIAAAAARQVKHLNRLAAEVAAIYRTRDARWWSARYTQALAPDADEPLRILIPTHRFSTFVRHSADDLAAALHARGCTVEILMEPDDSSRLATTAYLDAFSRSRPDLVVLINYTRHNLPGAIPAGVPVVCWIQDALSHLFREDVGRAQADLDFLVGHLHPELFSLFKYPPRDNGRALPTPVVVSASKFHPRPVPPALAAQMTCEIAYASNQSETPEACRDRLIAESAASPASARAVGALYERIKDICADTMTSRVGLRLEAAAREEIARVGAPDDPKTIAHALNQWCRPIADRILRHESARWAAELARERGWRFYLYGRGWENHPTLARHARGTLDHGEDLRASYQCAAVHLHASVNWSLHQRIMECALSGGLPLCRLKRDDLSPIETHVIRSMIDHAAPAATWLPTRALLYATADSPPAMAAAALWQRLDLSPPHFWGIQPPWLQDPSTYDAGLPMDHDTAWLLGDLAETTFRCKATLAQAVTRATTRPNWRTDTTRGISTRVHHTLTYTQLATRILTMLHTNLAPKHPPHTPSNPTH